MKKKVFTYQLREWVYRVWEEVAGKEKNLLGFEDIVIEHPGDPNYGDYSTNVAMVLAGKLEKRPLEIAKLLKKELKKIVGKEIGKIEVVAPGFINFWLSKDYLIDKANLIQKKDFLKEISKFGKGKTMVIDYSAPNIAKSFGIGHLRSTNIGQAIYNLYQILGWKTIGDNHLGDWGTQFGKLIVAIKKWWNKDLQNLTVKELEKLYVKFHKEAKDKPELEDEGRFWFKKLEQGNKEAKRIWQFCVDISLKEFDEVYKLLGIKIDCAYGESFYHFNGWMDKVLEDVKNKKLLKTSRGAKVVYIPGLNVPGILIKSDGATMYLLRDLATVKFRVQKWQPDLIVYEVGTDQKLYFQQVFSIAEKLGYISSDKLIHIAHGLIRWPHGKFSTRKGDTIHLADIIKKAIRRSEKLVNSSQTGKVLSQSEKKKIAKAVGIGGIKFNDLKQEPQKDIIFDWDKILSIEGYSSPYLQYTYARSISVLTKSGGVAGVLVKNYKFNFEEMALLRTFYQFPEKILVSASEFSPHILCQYLFDLAQKFNLFYQKHRILNSKPRLFLTRATANVLKIGLGILGIEALEKM